MNSCDISIIIVSYNTQVITCEAIESVYNSKITHGFEVIVVDNNSTDDTVKELKILEKKFKTLTVIENKYNEGFSKANNIGVAKAKGRYVLFLNSDTLVYEKTIDEMIKFMDLNPQAGCSTCFVELPNKKLDDAAHRGFPTPWNSFSYFSGLSKLIPTKFFASYNLSYLPLTTVHEIDSCAGAFMLIRREAGEEVGWWDEDFFWYGEDIDFCYRLKEKGWKIYFVSQVKILHYKGVSGGIKKHSSHLSKADLSTRERATIERFRAMQLFYKKHYEKKYPKFISQLVFMGINYKMKSALSSLQQ